MAHMVRNSMLLSYAAAAPDIELAKSRTVLISIVGSPHHCVVLLIVVIVVATPAIAAQVRGCCRACAKVRRITAPRRGRCLAGSIVYSTPILVLYHGCSRPLSHARRRHIVVATLLDQLQVLQLEQAVQLGVRAGFGEDW